MGLPTRGDVVDAACRLAHLRDPDDRATLAAALWLALKFLGSRDTVPLAGHVYRHTGVRTPALLAAEAALCAAADWRLWPLMIVS